MKKRSWQNEAQPTAPAGRPYLEIVRGRGKKARVQLRAGNHEVVFSSRPYDQNDGADSEGDARKAALRARELLGSTAGIVIVDRDLEKKAAKS